MKSMTMQEIFDIAILGIINQGGPAINSYGKCEYRTYNGLKCAIGHLIADKDYVPAMEGKTASQLAGYHGDVLPEISDLIDPIMPYYKRLSFYRNLQRCHDMSIPKIKENFWNNFKESCIEFARAYQLSIAVISKFPS